MSMQCDVEYVQPLHQLSYPIKDLIMNKPIKKVRTDWASEIALSLRGEVHTGVGKDRLG